MRLIFCNIVLSLICLSSFGQISDRVKHLILNDLSELDKLRKDKVIDSVAHQDLLKAYHFKDSTLKKSMTALSEADSVGQDFKRLYGIAEVEASRAKKDIKKQKFLKWVFLAGAGLIIILMAR